MRRPGRGYRALSPGNRVCVLFAVHFLVIHNPSPSTLRKAQDSLSDPKYFGKRVSRTQLIDDDDHEGSSPPDSQVEESESTDRGQTPQEHESDTAEPSSQQETQPDVAQTSTQTRQEDRKRGLAVSRQLVWRAYPFNRSRLTF
jgi:protein AATF/BFR2